MIVAITAEGATTETMTMDRDLDNIETVVIPRGTPLASTHGSDSTMVETIDSTSFYQYTFHNIHNLE